MNSGKYVFSRGVSFLNLNEFIKCIKCCDGNYKVLHFTCWHQLMCLLFGQLSNRESLSDLMICLATPQSRWDHLGMGVQECDQTMRLNNDKAVKDYPEQLRRIKYYDAQTDSELEFMTHKFSRGAADIALLYKYR